VAQKLDTTQEPPYTVAVDKRCDRREAMLTTVKGTFKQGKIELDEMPDEVEDEAPVLVTFLASNASVSTKQPKDFYGAWKGKISADFDVEAALKEIRGEWPHW
jgi:hypothetical protein